MPLDRGTEPVTDLGEPDEPAATLYAHVQPRADGDWGVQIRGLNHQPVWGNMEGWQGLGHALRSIRELNPQMRIVVVTDEAGAPTVIEPGDALP